jgi:hypothetical protein
VSAYVVTLAPTLNEAKPAVKLALVARSIVKPVSSVDRSAQVRLICEGETAVAVRLSGAAGGLTEPASTDTRDSPNDPARARSKMPCDPGCNVPTGIVTVSPLAGTSMVPTDRPSTNTSTRPPLLDVAVARTLYPAELSTRNIAACQPVVSESACMLAIEPCP